MSLTDLAALGSFLSGVGVLVSLLLLVFQLRQVSSQIVQAERNQQATIQQERYGRVFEVNLATVDPVAADAIAKGMAGTPDMSATEVTQFRGYASARFQLSENTFLQHKAGLLGEEAFNGFVSGLIWAFGSPGVRVMWRWSKPAHAPDFIAFIEALIAKAQPAAPADLVTQWKADLAELDGPAASAGS
jgi:hypothetical protein